MHYGNPKHMPGVNDLTIIGCRRCGWRSPEQTQEQMQARGTPWWCDECDGVASSFVTFAPHERAEALEIARCWITNAELDEHRKRAQERNALLKKVLAGVSPRK